MFHTRKFFVVGLALLLVVLLASSALAANETVQMAEHPTLGAILTDSQGMTLYLFTKDEAGVSNCYDQCAANWPPLLTDGEAPVAGENVTGELGLIERTDGSSQVTYNQMPLYYFARDSQAGDVNGQNVNDVWYVVHPDITMMTVSDPVINVTEHPELGAMLTSQGMSLYMFKNDEANISNCSNQCAANWPPLLAAAGTPVAGKNVSGELGLIERSDGSRQVTYNQIPLYFWINDVRPGDATGEGVNEVWFVVNPESATVAPAPVAQATPSVTVSDQPIANGAVTVAQVVSNGPGWLVIHAQADGKPGPVLGYSPVVDGQNSNVSVSIDESGVTEVLYAMLHTDAGVVGTYEFPGEDVPVQVDGQVVTPPFNVMSQAPAALPQTGGVLTSWWPIIALFVFSTLLLTGGWALYRFKRV